jgi:hypothetical protein
MEMTTTTTRTFAQASPELDDDDMYGKHDIETEESSDDDSDIDYTASTIAALPVPAKIILDMIKDCKSLVKYVKKVTMTETSNYGDIYSFFQLSTSSRGF